MSGVPLAGGHINLGVAGAGLVLDDLCRQFSANEDCFELWYERHERFDFDAC